MDSGHIQPIYNEAKTISKISVTQVCWFTEVKKDIAEINVTKDVLDRIIFWKKLKYLVFSRKNTRDEQK